MKKLLFAAAIAAFTMTSVNAQQFGAKAGLNMATVVGDNTDNNKMVTSFHVGAVAEFEINDQFSFQPELVYSMQGTKVEYTLLGQEIESSIEISYINIPLMAKYYVTEELSLQAGPQIGFLMSAESKSGSTTSDMKDETKNVDFGLNFGLGYKMDNGLFFDARYNLGLSDLVDERANGDDDKISNAVIQLSIGYNFDL